MLRPSLEEVDTAACGWGSTWNLLVRGNVSSPPPPVQLQCWDMLRPGAHPKTRTAAACMLEIVLMTTLAHLAMVTLEGCRTRAGPLRAGTL